MKSIISIIILIVAVSLTADAQRFDYKSTTDTLTNADTVTTTLGYFLKGKYNVQYQVNADSRSGSTAGTTVLQVASCESCSDWANVGTSITINGVTTAELKTTTIYGGLLRLRTISTGTQSTALRQRFIIDKE